MATKKTAAEPIEEVKEEAAAEQTEPAEKPAEKPVDPWDEMVEIMVPRKPKGEEEFYYVCCNDRRFEVPANGKRQSMPRPIAEILLASVEAEYAAQDFAEQMSKHAADSAKGL